MGWEARIEPDFLTDELRPEYYSPEALAFERYRLAQGDQLIALRHLCSSFTVGLFGYQYSPHLSTGSLGASTEDTIPVVTPRDVGRMLSHRISIDELRRVPREKVPAASVQGRDALIIPLLLFSRLQVLDASEVRGLDEFVAGDPWLLVLRPQPGISSSYLKLLLESEGARAQLRRRVRSGVVPRISPSAITEMLVPSPSSVLGQAVLSETYWSDGRTLRNLAAHGTALSPSPPPSSSGTRLPTTSPDQAATGAYPRPPSDVRLVAPLSPRDAVRNALALAAEQAPPELVAYPLGGGLFLPVEQIDGRLLARLIEFLDGRPDAQLTASRSVSTELDLTRFRDRLLKQQPFLLNQFWISPPTASMAGEMWTERALLRALGRLGSTEDADRIDAFVDYALASGLIHAIQHQQHALTLASEWPPEIDTIVRAIWDWHTQETPQGEEEAPAWHRPERARLLDAVSIFAAFRGLTLASLTPLLALGVSAPDGSLLGMLIVPLTPLGDSDIHLASLSESLLAQIEAQVAMSVEIQQTVVAEVVGRIRHKFRNRFGNLEAILNDVREYLETLPIRDDYIVPEEVVRGMVARFGDSPDDYTVLGSLHRMQEQIDQLKSIVLRLEQYYRIGSRPSELIRVNDELQKQLADWSVQHGRIAVTFDLDVTAPLIAMPRDAFWEILDNILDNGAKHLRLSSPPSAGHELLVRSRVDRDRVVLEIRNTGDSSLPPNPTGLWVTTGADRGTGLGLSIVLQNARAVGGSFEIFPNADGPGVTNRLTFPNAEWHSQPEA